MGKDLFGGVVQNDLAGIHHDDPVALRSLVHVVGDEDNRDAVFAVELLDGFHDLTAAARVKHGRRLVEDDALWPHGDDAGDGNALLLPAGKAVRRVLFVLIDADIHQRAVHTLPDLLGRDADVLQAEGDVLLHHGGDNLVVRVLEHHPHLLADVVQPLLVGGVDAVHIDLAA